VLNSFEVFGEREGGRTLDLLIKSQLLYRLSYALPNQASSVASGSAAEHRCDLPIGQLLLCRVFATKRLVFTRSDVFSSKEASVRRSWLL
jgi:hypothetical protein